MDGGAGRGIARFAVVLAMALATGLPAVLSAAGSEPSPHPTANPYIVSTQPSDGATGVGQRWLLTATFSEPMNTSSVYVTVVPFVDHGQTWYTDEKRLLITHSGPFTDCTLYTVEIAGTDKNGSALVPGPVPNPWNFTTAGCGNPTIVTTEPANGATGVWVSPTFNVMFGEVMDTSSVTWAFSDPNTTFSSSWRDETLSLAPTTPLAQCTSYSIGITAGTDLSGNPLGPGSVPNPWSFTTICGVPFIVSTVPAHGSVDVALDAYIVVAFSEAMNTTSVTVTFVMGPPVPFAFSWSGGDTVLTLTHTRPFTACYLYRILVNGKDLAGDPLAPGPVPNPWDFATACPGPYIVSTSPMDGETNVSLTAPIIVVFSEAMEPANVTVTVTPAIVLNFTWSGGFTVLTITHPSPFMECVAYSIAVYGYGASGVPLQPGPVPNPWTFTTACGTAPVTLVSPAGGESWTGGSTHTIAWQQTPTALLDWRLDWSQDDGATWTAIANGSAGPGNWTYDWVVPAVNTTTARVRVCVSGALPPACDASGSFTIDSAAPILVSHDPPDGAIDIPTPATLTATFSEAMDAAATEAAFWITPTALVTSIVWPAPDTLALQLEGLMPSTRYLWGFGCTATDGSDPGNPLANCQETHSFTTAGTPGPIVALLSPAGGESWTGATSHSVNWTMADARDPVSLLIVWINYTSSSGLGRIAGPATGFACPCSYAWMTPAIDATDVVVQVTVLNTAGANATDASGALEIDSTAPAVMGVLPVLVHPRDPLTIAFTEPMASLPTTAALAISPAPGGLTFAWDPPRTTLTVGHADFVACAMYTLTVAVSARDDSLPGNPLAAPFARSFLVSCVPSVDLLAPDGGEDWTGGTVHDIRWTTADGDDGALAITLSYSLDGGADGFPHTISSGLVVPTGAGSLPWTVPMADVGEVLVRIDVADAAGNTATDASAAVFTVDSTPPELLVSFPANGSSAHRTTRAIWFVWTERVDRASFVASFSLSPDPGELTFAWTVSNLGGDVLLVDHKAFASKTAYTARFAPVARDDSDPGNPLAAEVVVGFSTQPPPEVNPPVAKAVGQNQVEVGVPATFDGTGSTGDIREYTWRVVDNHGRFVAVLVGARATYTFSENGRYSVTLFVTDANGASDDDTIEIAVTSNPHSSNLLVAGAAGAALLTAVLVGGTEVGRLAAFSLVLFPVTARRKKDDPAERETRGMIRGYVLVHPGDSYTDIKRNLGLGNGTVSYHLTALEKEGIIRSQVRGSRKLFFPREARLPEDGGGLHEVQLRMLRAVQAIPGLAVTDLAGALGISSQLALYHLRDLAAKGRIRFERRGLRLRCYAEDSNPAPMD